MAEITWEAVESLFHEALALPEQKRAGFLADACHGNQTLYLKVSHLLAHYREEDQFLKEVDMARLLGASELEGPILEEGRRLGRYEGVRLVGRGGMGEVYLAYDPRLGRKVAVKILPKGFFTVPGDIERLRREAQMVSALAAPNIVTVYDFDEQDGLQYMVTEFVEGVSLRELIGHLSTGQALHYARQIGEALKAAHARGIIHRDIKPENIMVRSSDDCIKVLDFGLAKLTPAGPESGKSLYERLAESDEGGLPGLAGTVSYMSPEQVREQRLDARTDIWSWGVVLYEMLAGARPFQAPTTREIFGAILHAGPHPPGEDRSLNQVVSKALSKQLEDRYATMAEALEDLARIPATATATATAKRYRRWGQKIAERVAGAKKWLAVAAAVLILAAIGSFSYINRASLRPFQLGKMTRLTASGNVTQAAISPDARYLAYATKESGGQSLRILEIGTNGNLQPLPLTAAVYAGITFSTDGKFIYYVLKSREMGSLHRIPLLGGAPELVTDRDVDSPVSFSPNGKRFVFLRIDAVAGRASMVLRGVDDEREETIFTLQPPRYFFRDPLWSADGSSILCGVMDNSGSSLKIEMMSVRVADGQSRTIGPEPWHWMYRPASIKGGHSIAVSAPNIESNRSQIWEFSLADGRVTPITNDTLDYRNLDSPPGLRELIAVQMHRNSHLGFVDLDHPDRYRDVPEAGQQLLGLSWTPSARVISQIDVGGHPEFWEIDPSTAQSRQLTFDAAVKEKPVVSSDGRTLVYASAQDGISHLWRRRMDGSDQAVRLTSARSRENQAAMTSDGRWVIYTSSESGFQALWKVSVDGGTPIQLTQRPARKASVSPDGKLIVCEYADDPQKGWAVVILDSSTLKVLRSFPQVPASDDALPVHWSADGKGLLYAETSNANIWLQPLNDSSPRQLTHFSSEQIFAFAPSPDGRSLACLRGSQTSDVVLAQAAK
ncbi:MAG TPA: protein kinase [Candidatus Saccharimonadales bacterium]|nr:protein kinase [Candidatus Saccharimonadales bacterium]